MGKPRAQQPPWSVSATREEVRAYVQERIALFAKAMFWIFWVLVAFVMSMYEVHPETRPQRAWIVHWAAIFFLLLLGVLWFFGLRKRKVSLDVLYAIDTANVVVISVVLAMSAYFSSDLIAAVYSAFIWHTFMVFSRVIIVPSTPKRTAIVTSLAYVPIVVSGIGSAIYFPERLLLPELSFVMGAVVFAAVSILLCTTGSRVIYGLRRQVNEAMQLGQYRLDEKIGEGGMGVVYRASHAMLRRPTAIKMLPPSKVGAESLARFEREVQHTSRLTHPNTVAVFDYGRTPDGIFYYAMEYLDGVELETLVREDGPQEPARVIHILVQVCGALDEAHSMGLTHRDIKPQNIILCQRGLVPDVAKVLDFGLVKEIATEDDRVATKLIAGTPAYLAPEGVTDPKRVGPASDLYALGAVGYYLLTGRRVFDGRTAMEVCIQHATAEPVRPSLRVDQPIPEDLEDLIMACLQKDPTKRPASAKELRRKLAALPAYEAWDEHAASLWWTEFQARRANGPPPADSLSITIDVVGRTELSDETGSGLLGHLASVAGDRSRA